EHLRLDPGAVAVLARAGVVPADGGRIEERSDAESVAVAVVVRVARTNVVAIADAIAVVVDETARRRAAPVPAVPRAVVALPARLDDTVAAAFENALVVAAVAVDEIAVVALLTGIEIAVAARGRRGTGAREAHEIGALQRELLGRERIRGGDRPAREPGFAERVLHLVTAELRRRADDAVAICVDDVAELERLQHDRTLRSELVVERHRARRELRLSGRGSRAVALEAVERRGDGPAVVLGGHAEELRLPERPLRRPELVGNCNRSARE